MSRTVLIVEDAGPCAVTLEIALTEIAGVDVRVTRTGEEALRMLEDSSSAVCAMVTDIHLPTMDGFELVERVRTTQPQEGFPILVVSGDSDPRTPQRILRLGANAYFPKPYSPSEIRRKLEQLLNANP